MVTSATCKQFLPGPVQTHERRAFAHLNGRETHRKRQGEGMERTRRSFLAGVGAGAAMAGMPRLARAWAAAPQVSGSLALVRDQVLAQVPENFTGLSYESAQLIHPAFLSAANTQLVTLLRTLGAHGVLRIGGNTSAFTKWAPRGGAANDSAAYGPDRGLKASHQTPGMYPLTPLAIDNVNALLQATGWQLIYGLNLENGTPEAAAEEAAYVVRVCGPRLLALQFGNEPDLFQHDDNGTPAKRWTYAEFWTKWQAMYKVVHARVPQARIAGPDSAFNKDWAGKFAADAKGMISMLTTHYYPEGPPTDPSMTIDRLLHPGQRLYTSVLDALNTAKAEGMPYRMSEGNSCYQGGKAGVSDTFGAALWAADFMLDLAAHGATGVNFHGGANGLYSPIIGMQAGHLSVRPDYYGMLLGGEFAGTRMIRTVLNAGSANVTAYAAQQTRGLQAAVINKSGSEIALTLQGAPARGAVRTWPLSAPALDSKSGVTFGGSALSDGGTWRLGGGQAMPTGPLRVPAYSAVLVRWGA